MSGLSGGPAGKCAQCGGPCARKCNRCLKCYKAGRRPYKHPCVDCGATCDGRAKRCAKCYKKTPTSTRHTVPKHPCKTCGEPIKMTWVNCRPCSEKIQRQRSGPTASELAAMMDNIVNNELLMPWERKSLSST